MATTNGSIERRTSQRADCAGVVIAGGGLSGQRCAETLRRSGFDGPIRIVCAEVHRPYDRPPLSKAVLAGVDAPTLDYRPQEWYRQHDVELVLGVPAGGLRPAERRLELSDGSELRYGKLLVATGGRPRMLPMLASFENVSVLRTLDDALALRAELGTGHRLAVVGAGLIGLEIAATARGLGTEVTLIEAGACPVEAVLGTRFGGWLSRLHQSEGVTVLTGVTVTEASGNGRVTGLACSDGMRVTVDHVVVGIGIQPDTSWLADSGLDAAAGVPVDLDGRTALDGVFAAGDAAATFDPMLGRHVPGSHWEAAARQGARAARAMLGLAQPSSPPASFWTDQYGLRIHYVGDSRLADAVQVDGEPDGREFTATFTHAGRAVAALLVNRPRSLPAAREQIQKGST